MSVQNPARWLSKEFPHQPPPRVIETDFQATRLSCQNVIFMSTWKDSSPLLVHIIELDSVPLSHKVLQLPHVCYMRVTVEPYKPRAVPPLLMASAILS